MSYYEILSLKKEPFSTSPDPYFMYPSLSHQQVIKRLETVIRLKRGLSLVLGDVGVGKTTLGRSLLQILSKEDSFMPHMILDPVYDSEFQFVVYLAKLFGIKSSFRSTLDYKEAIERFLFKKCVDEKSTVILVIDEAQKLYPSTLEILRTLLNFETNEYKLIQLVIIGQMELLPKLKRIKNFSDRVSLKYILNPFDINETKDMIRFRLKQAGYNSGKSFFTEEAMNMIYEYTQGYPRKIANLCHSALEELVMKESRSVDENLIQELIERDKVVALA
ncbi:MAG: AAA family ATPase [Candidatus Omnitrophota bacterium]